MARTPPRSLPSVLNYERSLHPTTAAFYAVNDDGQTPVRVARITVLGVRADPVESATEADYASGNPQRVEAATLPVGYDRLRIVFGLTVTPSSLSPRACDVPTFRQALQTYASAYREASGFHELARRYATNIANGRFCWRNLSLANACMVVVKIDSATYRFDATKFNLDDFNVPNPHTADLNTVAAHIAQGLAGPRPTRLQVIATLDMGNGAVVWPSQEFAARNERDNTDIGKVLFKFPVAEYTDVTGFHEQKVGAALRTIDTWHQGYPSTDNAEVVCANVPVCVNPYAQHREAHVVLRGRDGGGAKDFYTLLRERHATPPVTPDGDDHFLMANLVRGGVFPIGGKKAPAAPKNATADQPMPA